MTTFNICAMFQRCAVSPYPGHHRLPVQPLAEVRRLGAGCLLASFIFDRVVCMFSLRHENLISQVIPKNYTPPKTNMFPENQWLEDVFPIELVPFSGTC